jgi:hypothetical protein
MKHLLATVGMYTNIIVTINYAQNNSRWICERHFQTVYSTNVWWEKNYRTIFLRKKKRSTIFKFSVKTSANFVGGVDLHRRQNMWLQQDGRAPSFPPRCETLFRHTVENNCRLYRVIINDCSRSRDVHVMKFLPVSCELSIFDAVTVIF